MLLIQLKASSPACTELETIVMDWLAKAIGLPPVFYHSNKDTLGGGVIQVNCDLPFHLRRLCLHFVLFCLFVTGIVFTHAPVLEFFARRGDTLHRSR